VGKHVLALDEPRPTGPGFVAFVEEVEQAIRVVTYIATCSMGVCQWKGTGEPVIANVGDMAAQAEAVHRLRRHWETMHPYDRETWGAYV
jgi:hypothetical protein